MIRVNPDKDVQPAGQFKIYHASETISAVYSPEGEFFGSMRTKRNETLLQAHQNTTSSELCDFLKAIADLIAGYRDGSKFGSHTVADKDCYTALPSLTTALISALGATTGLSATLFDFNPKQSTTPPHLQKMQSSMLTKMHYHSSGKEAATVTHNPRISKY